MAINFPSSGLTVGQIVSLGDRSWEWDGEKWKSTGTTSGTPIGATIVFEGAVENAHQTTLTVAEPTADRTITLQNADGTVAFTSDIPTVAGVYALLDDPTFIGTPEAPTAAADTNTTQIATTQYVQTELGALSSDSITDADANTKIQVEESSDENIIRFDTAGTERMTISAAGVVATVGDLTVGGNATIQSLDMDDIVAGDVIYGSGADTLARLAKGSNDEVLTLASGIPSWAAIPAAASDEIIDADSDTKIQVEESADEDKIRFDTGGTERVVIDSSGLDIKSGDLMVADGSGIIFATPDSSGSVTAAGNRFDDYEEGSWVPAMTTTGSGTLTCSGTLGYIKIGKMVWVHGYFNVTSVSSPTGRAQITNFPYTSENGSTTIHMVHPIAVHGLDEDLTTLGCSLSPNTTEGYIRGKYNTDGVYYENTAPHFSGNESVYLNFHYRAAY